MPKLPVFRSKVVYAAHVCLFITVAICSAQQSKVMGEVRFEGATKVEKDSGVWVMLSSARDVLAASFKDESSAEQNVKLTDLQIFL